MNEQPVLPVPPVPSAGVRRFGVMLKLAAIGFLTLLLLIPLLMIGSVLRERLARRDQAVSEITSTWGESQVLCGPVLTIPYKYRVTSWKDQVVNGKVGRVQVEETLVARAHFLPAELKVVGDLAPSQLHRGIYQAVVYRANLKLSGRFAPPSFEEWKVAPADVLWDEAMVSVSITDLRGAQEALSMSWGGAAVPLLPGSKLAGLAAGVHARLKDAWADHGGAPFEMDFALNGSRGIQFAPVGMQNEVKLASPWPDPSFSGSFLPAERTVSASGFDAMWKCSFYGRSYPQQWSTQESGEPFSDSAVRSSLFGVYLLSVVDSYRFVERSIKYGILFLVLVFAAFFLFEVLAAVRVHPFQYTLVGAGLCLFYLALLSLSEFLPFGTAYLAGAAASALLIAIYSATALRSARRAVVIAGELAVIYGFLFIILRLQDYSLLFGTAGLFIALGLIMYLTRNIDWYARDGR